MNHVTGQSPDRTADRWDDALSSRWLPLILLFGAPPPHPNIDGWSEDDARVPLQVFGSYIRELAEWTNRCREQYMEWEGIDDDQLEWGEPYNRCKREAFDREFLDWAYTLKPEDY